MKKINKIIFGDNQFFGINHMSQEKAQQQVEKFYDFNNISNVYDIAIEAGVKAMMLNSNHRAKEICDFFKKSNKKYDHISWYPSIPYPYKYANMVSEKGIALAINEVLFKDSSFKDLISMASKGSSAVFKNDAITIMKMLIDVEMKVFKNLSVNTIFLQNIITDLILGLDLKDFFIEYVDYIKTEYKVNPGFITQNMSFLLSKLEAWNIKNVVVCFSLNKIGYLVSPNLEIVLDKIHKNNSGKYQLMAMCTLASGAINPVEAYEFINKLNIQSVVFGASSKKNIEQTISLIK